VEGLAKSTHSKPRIAYCSSAAPIQAPTETLLAKILRRLFSTFRRSAVPVYPPAFYYREYAERGMSK
jgi:predicted nuclease with RNAse H fold